MCRQLRIWEQNWPPPPAQRQKCSFCGIIEPSSRYRQAHSRTHDRERRRSNAAKGWLGLYGVARFPYWVPRKQLWPEQYPYDDEAEAMKQFRDIPPFDPFEHEEVRLNTTLACLLALESGYSLPRLFMDYGALAVDLHVYKHRQEPVIRADDTKETALLLWAAIGLKADFT